MFIKVKSTIEDLVVAGGSTGILEVDTTNFYVGAEAWLSNTAADQSHVRITKIIDSTHLKVKLLPSGYMAEDYSKGFDATGYDFATATLVGADQADGVYDAVLVAVDTGRDGNLITIELVGDSPLGVHSSLDLATTGLGNIDTVIEAVSEGVAGDSITVVLDGSGGLGTGVVIGRIVNAFTITYEEGVSTVLNIETAIGALAGANKLIRVKTASTTPAYEPVSADDDFGPTNLAGGVDGDGVTIDRIDAAFVIHYETEVSTVGDINTAIGALAGADDLFDVDTAGTIANVLTAPDDDFGPVALSGGSTPSLAMPAQIVKVNPKFVKKTSA